MPTSGHIGKVAIAFVMKRLAADVAFDHIADVGPGMGTYRRLLDPVYPAAAWTAIEAWAPYVETYRLKELYEQVRIADVRNVDFESFAPGGLVIFGDVMEHLPKDDAIDVVRRAMRRFAMGVVSIPIGPWPQGEVGGNPFEAHVASWSRQDAVSLFPDVAASHYVPVSPDTGLAAVFLARDETLRRQVARIVADLEELQKTFPPALVLELPFCPDYADGAVISCIHDKVDRALVMAYREPTGAKALFRNIYLAAAWGKGETRSGGGSTLAHTAGLRRALGGWIARSNIRSIADAGCGEANWQETMCRQFGLYVGYDVVPEIVRRNQDVLGGTANFVFAEADITTQVLPRFDAIVCRHVLTHWPSTEAIGAIQLFRKSGARFLLATSYESTGDHAAPTGSWRTTNLVAAPYGLGEPMEWLDDSPNGIYRLGVWALGD